MCEFEPIAKLTFVTSLLDEQPIALARPDTELLLGTVLSENADELTDLFRRPTFWNFDRAAPRFRADLSNKPVVPAGREGLRAKPQSRWRPCLAHFQRYLSMPRTLS